jgi:hypothetical protein
LSANRALRRVAWQGTYMVNPDCTGSMTLYVSPLGATGDRRQVAVEFGVNEAVAFFDKSTAQVMGTAVAVSRERQARKRLVYSCRSAVSGSTRAARRAGR